MVDYNEHFIEKRAPVDPANLQAGFIPDDLFAQIHRDTCIVTHDAVVGYDGGLLLLQRDNDPERGEWWFIGGRIPKGVSLEDSLRGKVKEECGLDMGDLTLLDIGRCMFATDPFGHGKGTDTLSLTYFAHGEGTLAFDEHHSDYKIVRPRELLEKEGFVNSLHPCVSKALELAMPYING